MAQHREGRSLMCPDCRATHRRARKAETQRARRGAPGQDLDIEDLLGDLRHITARLGDYLARQKAKADTEGKQLTAVQKDAQTLVEKADALTALVSKRGLKHERRPRQH